MTTKSWTAALLFAALCVVTLLSTACTLLVLSTALLPTEEWLVATVQASQTLWKTNVLGRRWRKASRRLWRRLDALLHGTSDGTAAPRWHGEFSLLDIASPQYEGDAEDDDEVSDDECERVVSDWKHGRLCVISR